MKLIKISSKKYSNLFAKVDDRDYGYLNSWKWGIMKSKGNFYAKRYNGGGKRLSMARAIMFPLRKLVVDHINHDTLDNQRHNLRICTNAQNIRNQKLRRDNRSGLTGIIWHKKAKKWMAYFVFNGNQVYLGIFKCPLLAKIAYDNTTKKHYGEYKYQLGG